MSTASRYRLHNHTCQRGVTLMELSIVLIILGLITGGILAGRQIIRASEIKSITSDLNTYKRAITTFMDKYNAMPGDMVNATTFWGAAHATPATCIITQGTGTQTCNGDGDRKISAYVLAAATINERFRAWQQMSNAGIISGTFSGIAGPNDSGHAIPGWNVPEAKIQNTGWRIIYFGSITGNTNLFDYEYSHTLSLSGESGNNYKHMLLPDEQWGLDAKIDDGKPGSGIMFSAKNTSIDMPGCATTDVAATAQYNVALSGTICSPIFNVKF